MMRRSWRWRLLLVLLVVAVALAAYSWIGARTAWRQVLETAGFVDEMSPPAKGDRILVVAPHPDDETLGCSGLIQQAVAAGAQVHVVLMTNGDGSELSLVFGENEVPWKQGAFVELGRKRQEETLSALSLAGVPASRVYFLGYPNNALMALWRPEHWYHTSLYRSPYTHDSFSPYERSFTPRAPYCGQQVLSDLLAIMQLVRPTSVYVTHPRDIHPDHCSTYMFVRYALATAAARGADWAGSARVFGYLVHWPRYPLPRRFATNQDLLPPVRLSGRNAGWLRLPLTREQVRLKLRQIRLYRSQKPSFDRLLLAFARRNETFDLLPGSRMELGKPHEWIPRGRSRRPLGGAQVDRLRLTVSDNLKVQADLDCDPRKLPKNGYVCLDLRTWNEQGTPIITTAYVRPGPQISASRLGASIRSERLSVSLVTPSAGRFETVGLTLPADSLALRELFVACWGSVRDRTVDPAVADLVKFSPAPPS